MINKILQKCGYFIKNKKIFLSIISFILISTLVISITSLQFIDNSDKDVAKEIRGISLLNNEELAEETKKSMNEIIDNYLKEYSKYYNLDGDKVVLFARQITNDYSISFNEVGGKYTSETKEGQCLLFVYYLSRDNLNVSLKDYNLTKEYFETENIMTTMGNDQILSSGLTFSQFLGKACDNLNLNKYYLLAISYLETGMNTSSLALRNNNFGGLRGRGEYYSYTSPEEGIISFILNLKGYEKYNLADIYELSGIYTHGNKYNPSSTWVNSVERYYNEIINNPSNYFLVKDI